MENKWGIYNTEIKLAQNQFVGKVIRRNRNKYLIADDNTIFNAEITGKMKYNTENTSQLPIVGDWVIYELHKDFAVIHDIAPRISVISRKVAGVTTEEQPIAANINLVGIVFSLDGGRNYNPRALERYLTIAWNSGALPVVILNKADLCDNPESIKSEVECIASGVEVFVTSAQTKAGIDSLRNKIPIGKTIVFIGPSGVGKSALTNALLGEENQVTGEIRQKDKRGKHTTTTSKLVQIPGGGVLIDSPGLREIQLWGDLEDINSVFDEIAALAVNCKFNDCTHSSEPGCAIQQALSAGILSLDRYESYQNLKREMLFLESKQSDRARHEYNAKGKNLAKFIKNMKNKKIIY